MTEKYVVITNKLELELMRMRSEGKFKLPSENDLASRFSCSRQTIRSSLEILKDRGLIEKRKGAGSFIVDDSLKSKSVYLITEDCDRYLSPALIQGLRAELPPKYQLYSFSTYGSYKTEAEMIKRAIEEKASAIIIEPLRDLIPNVNERLLKDAMDLLIPVIVINSSSGPSGVMRISPDFRAAGKELTRCLKEKGRKNIGCIFCSDSSSGMDEYKGYLESVPLFDDSRCLLISHKEEQEMISGKVSLLNRFVSEEAKDCDAVICQNGMIAHILTGLLSKAGMSVPSDIAVACFDNGYYSLPGGISMGYDNNLFSRKLARMVTNGDKDAVIPMRKVLETG